MRSTILYPCHYVNVFTGQDTSSPEHKYGDAPRVGMGEIRGTAPEAWVRLEEEEEQRDNALRDC